jgi:hypothetical protein
MSLAAPVCAVRRLPRSRPVMLTALAQASRAAVGSLCPSLTRPYIRWPSPSSNAGEDTNAAVSCEVGGDIEVAADLVVEPRGELGDGWNALGAGVLGGHGLQGIGDRVGAGGPVRRRMWARPLRRGEPGSKCAADYQDVARKLPGRPVADLPGYSQCYANIGCCIARSRHRSESPRQGSL